MMIFISFREASFEVVILFCIVLYCPDKEVQVSLHCLLAVAFFSTQYFCNASVWYL